MLLVLCVDLDDDLGRKTGLETPVIGRENVEAAAVGLATVDPEDSDVNVLFEGLHLYDRLEDDEAVEIAVVTGEREAGVTANRRVGAELDEVLASLTSSEGIRAVVVTDGAQDESVVPVIRSRVTVDGVRRVVVRQAQNLESMYYTIKQVLADPETRGTILVPMGILLLIYPLAIVAEFLGLPGAVLGVTSALVGLYFLFRGLGLEETFDDAADWARRSLYAGRVTLVTYVVAAVLLVIGIAEGVDLLNTLRAERPGGLDPLAVLAALTFGTVRWLAAAGVTTSLGQITDEFLAGRFEWRYLNAPFYVLAIAAVLHGVSGFFVGRITPTMLAVLLMAGTLMGVLSTLTFAVVESYRSGRARAS
jgi:putative membrane protein